jgi:phage shock protein C
MEPMMTDAVTTTEIARKAAPKPGLFGICAAIGEDFGFNPEYLRATLVFALLWNAAYVLAGYAAVGVVVAISRWLVPSARKTKKSAEIVPLDQATHTDAPAIAYARAA